MKNGVFRFDYMAVSDDRQRVMPTMRDRENGEPLAYPEAVLLTDPANELLRGEVTFCFLICNQKNFLDNEFPVHHHH